MNRGIQDIQFPVRLLLKNIVNDGDTVIDATAGLGRDTLFLAQLVGAEGKVYAFDVQKNAIQATQNLLKNRGMDKQVELYCTGHENISGLIKAKVKAAMFNLGYLPGSDRSIITKPHTTITALSSILDILDYLGVIILTVYRGHNGGEEESVMLNSFLAELPKKDFSVLEGTYLNQDNNSPYFVIVQKNRGQAHENPSSDEDPGTCY